MRHRLFSVTLTLLFLAAPAAPESKMIGGILLPAVPTGKYFTDDGTWVTMPAPIPGPPGDPGPAGADSTVPGPPGPPGADSTVPGPQGPSGPASPLAVAFLSGTVTLTNQAAADTGQYDDSWSLEAYGISPRVQQYILKTRVGMSDSERGVSLGKMVMDAMARSAAITRAMSAATAKATYTATPLGLSLPKRLAYRVTRNLKRKWTPLEVGLGATAAALVAGGTAIAKWPQLTDALQPAPLGGLLAAIGGGVATFLVTRRAQKDG